MEILSEFISMSQLKSGEYGRILHIGLEDTMRRRLQDLGMIPGTQVECVGVSPKYNFGEAGGMEHGNKNWKSEKTTKNRKKAGTADEKYRRTCDCTGGKSECWQEHTV